MRTTWHDERTLHPTTVLFSGALIQRRNRGTSTRLRQKEPSQEGQTRFRAAATYRLPFERPSGAFRRTQDATIPGRKNIPHHKSKVERKKRASLPPDSSRSVDLAFFTSLQGSENFRVHFKFDLAPSDIQPPRPYLAWLGGYNPRLASILSPSFKTRQRFCILPKCVIEKDASRGGLTDLPRLNHATTF
ncbi:uncharacterized protein BT62DRAFT_1003998 [Guyanagaster necrorhizus]|uniref:Uncharacterized protein n=1 Tax=Guyanagaster necrorhizus TaxID=856835 RepID=A0A9P7VVC2_9AGAR|nr:uncharacterized protein BT62DRAFT_1003998 [Guyanagaster necrorhizus MCA 3950]KAG7448201.1 hypothetical protein BT62DRAFT_1003998 [Guyanagaster necrorhizus MCA 3950]